jgi:hypothetical protein
MINSRFCMIKIHVLQERFGEYNHSAHTDRSRGVVCRLSLHVE